MANSKSNSFFYIFDPNHFDQMAADLAPRAPVIVAPRAPSPSTTGTFKESQWEGQRLQKISQSDFSLSNLNCDYDRYVFFWQDRRPLVTDYKDFPKGSQISFQDVCKMQSALRQETKKDHFQSRFLHHQI